MTNPEKFVPVGKTANVPWVVTKNDSVEQGLMGYLQGMVSKAKWYMSEAKNFAAKAQQDRQVTQQLTDEAKAAKEQAGVHAEAAEKSKAIANTSAESSLASSVSSKDSAKVAEWASQESERQVVKAEEFASQTAGEKEKVKNVADISLVDIQVAKQEAMKEIEWAIEKNNTVV